MLTSATLIICLLTFIISMFALLLSAHVWIKFQVQERSTHTIEYRNPDIDYPDEIDPFKPEPKFTPEKDDDDNIDLVNQILKEQPDILI